MRSLSGAPEPNDSCASVSLVEQAKTGATTSYSRSGLTDGQKYRLRVTGHDGGQLHDHPNYDWPERDKSF